jgi:hypothetical protein
MRAHSPAGSLYVDGREVEVTHNQAEGLWVDGLPGEIPGTPVGDPYGTAQVGDVLYGAEDSKLSKSEAINRTMCEHLDDIDEEISHDAETIQDLLDKNPRPTHSALSYDRMPALTSEENGHGFNVGHGVEASLVIGAVFVRLANKTRQGNRFHKKEQGSER